MAQTRKELESQIFVLEGILEKTPEVVGVKPDGGKIYNPRFFSITNKIKKLKVYLAKCNIVSDKRAWNEHLAR
jgi:hypothetical protein